MRKVKSIVITLLLLISFAMAGFAAGSGSVSKGSPSISELLDKADSLFNNGEYEKSRELYIKVSELARSSENKSDLAESMAMIARTYLKTGEMETGRTWLKKAGDVALPENPAAWSRYLSVRGRFEWKSNDLENATKTFIAMYNYCSEQKLYERAVDAANMVSITGNSEQQIEWGKKGIAEAEAGKIDRWLGPLWNNLGWTYEDIGKYSKALDAYLKAREYHYKYGTERNKLIADWAVGHAYRLNDQPDKAEEWLIPLPDRCRKIDETEFLGFSLKELGHISLDRQDNAQALKYFTESEEYLKKVGLPEWDTKGYEKLLEDIERLRKEQTD